MGTWTECPSSRGAARQTLGRGERQTRATHHIRGQTQTDTVSGRLAPSGTRYLETTVTKNHGDRVGPVPSSYDYLSIKPSIQILIIVEGKHDIHFLRRISRMLHLDDARLPDLGAWEEAGRLIFVPTAGGDFLSWAIRLAGLGLPEFHLYDREAPPETELRVRAAELVNRRPGCRAAVTNKRALENYLHPAAIREARGLDLAVADRDDMPETAAWELLARRHAHIHWSSLSRRARKRLRDRAKHWLNTEAVDRMTPARLAERDPPGEVRGWLNVIGTLSQTRV
jgi:putative ATP-dependent endonuclease of OLD family